MPFTPVFGGSTIYPSNATFLSLAFAADVQLEWPIEQAITGNVVADIIEANATVGALSLIMPDARQVTQGYTALFNNIGANTFSVKDSTGTTLMAVPSGQVWQLILSSNATAAGVWRVFQYGAGASSANAGALAGAGIKAITTTLNQMMAINSQAVDYVIVDGDRAKAVVWTGAAGTFTLPDPAVVGADWFVAVKNSGTGSVILDPAVGTIDGSNTLTLAVDESTFVVSNGVNYFTVGLGQEINSVFDFISLDVSGTGDRVLVGAELNRVSYQFTGILTGNRRIIVPAQVQQYWVDNSTTGAFTLEVKTAAGTGVIVEQGKRRILYCDGVNVISAETFIVSTPVAIADGGTGATTAPAALTALGAAPAIRIIGTAGGSGLSGGGDLSADRALTLDNADTRNIDHNTVVIQAGAGLTGGGDITINRLLNVGAGTGITVNVDDVQLELASTLNTDHAGVTITGDDSIVGGGDITASRILALDGDDPAPGNSMYYGTDGAGVKGFNPVNNPGVILAFGLSNPSGVLQADSKGITSVTHTGLGLYTIDYTAAGFSTVPVIVGSVIDNTVPTLFDLETVPTTTSVDISTNAFTPGSTAADLAFNFQLMGF